MNKAAAGTCVQDCVQYVHVASAPGEVQECEIRRRFVEGDNEQSAVLTGRALGWNCRPDIFCDQIGFMPFF